MSSNTCVIVSAMFMYGGVTVIVSREILTNDLCKRLLNISILRLQDTLGSVLRRIATARLI